MKAKAGLFLSLVSAGTALASRDALYNTPPFFLEKISRLSGIMGESRDSWHNPGLDEKAKIREI